jgi:hypothetical protein
MSTQQRSGSRGARGHGQRVPLLRGQRVHAQHRHDTVQSHVVYAGTACLSSMDSGTEAASLA